MVLAAAVVARFATWFCGFWKSRITGLIFLPIGTVVFFASIGAMVATVITMVDKARRPRSSSSPRPSSGSAC
jgi:hypothetical protein